jgi:hypothetical protein
MAVSAGPLPRSELPPAAALGRHGGRKVGFWCLIVVIQQVYLRHLFLTSTESRNFAALFALVMRDSERERARGFSGLRRRFDTHREPGAT